MKSLLQIACLIVVSSLPVFMPPTAGAADEKKYVLVTGTSTGIGRNLAETLAGKGYYVYAGVRNNEDFKALNAIDNITAVRMDVTKQDEIDAVVELIREKGTGLYGLVNNAGIGGGGNVLDTPIQDQTLVYDVNVEGVYRVTRAFAPFIIESKGRIATTGSIAGTISWGGGSAYAGSKHWIEAFSDALAAEMAPLGVSVSVIEPGNYQSFIRRSSVRRKHDKIIAAGGEMTEEMQKEYEATEARELSFKQPDDVSAAYMHALFDDEPLLRYVVVPNEREQAMTINTQINELVQLNEWGPYSFTEDELIKMLQQAMSKDKPAE